MAITRLSGGTTPANGSDPRTFPAIWNDAVDDIEAAEADITTLEGDVVGLKNGSLLPDATPTVAGVVRGATSDGSNTALGDGAFTSNTTGIQNTAVGLQALESNTSGNFNTAVGVGALNDNTSGVRNTAVGISALNSNTTGSENVAVGRLALENNTSGGSNTAAGQAALRFNTTSDNTMALGNGAASSSLTVNNEITLGNTAITSLRCNVTTISSLSDVRDKTDIVDTQHGLDTLNKIRPVDFTWARRDGTFGSAPDIGFIAQELASVEDETGDAQRLRLTLRNNPEKLEATPGRLIPILVKAVQELSAKNDELEARIVKLEGK